ncbi:hypothetical protein AWC38_SpisGene25839 [Stylophora pistillata]|uniref:Uncharacterized protein n=1 Tax=Stylophora pistillata TaxID=50429 RepID=A0A2B4SFV7_STYPI|nr:hypothetical protein AWC38_SpisGene25839 [Stylophora pistillata]
MASVNSRAELVPNRAYSPTSDDFMMDYDPEFFFFFSLKPRQDSYENMNGRLFFFFFSHHYEDPRKLKDEVFHRQDRRPHPPSRSGNKRPRRKTNEAYEPVSYSQKRRRTFTDDGSDDGYNKETCTKLFKVLAFFGFLFALGAAVVVVMLMLGFFFFFCCDDCKKELVPSQSSVFFFFLTGQDLWKVIKEMKSNLSELNRAIRTKNQIISQLQRRDDEHAGKILELEKRAAEACSFVKNYKLNISSLVGPRGPPGFFFFFGPSGKDGIDGRPGKTFFFFFSLCDYRVKNGVPFTAVFFFFLQNVIVTENTQERIIGVTCSTVGTTEYNLKSYFNGNQRQYQCMCRGQSSVFRSRAGIFFFFLHYWVCPLIF